jgi:hypothetical protein
MKVLLALLISTFFFAFCVPAPAPPEPRSAHSGSLSR